MRDTRSVVKAMYIYTFATLVEWPAEKRSGDFVIGVYGDKTAVFDELVDKYSGKSIGSQTIVINNYPTSKSIKDSHILYVTPEKTDGISDIASKWSSSSTLIVAEKNGALSRGAIVNFVVDGNQQKYEINKKNAKKHKLVIADKLSSLASNVIK